MDEEQLQAHIVARIRAQVNASGVTQQQLATRTGLSRWTIRRFLDGEQFTLKTGGILARTLRIPLVDMRMPKVEEVTPLSQDRFHHGKRGDVPAPPTTSTPLTLQTPPPTP